MTKRSGIMYRVTCEVRAKSRREAAIIFFSNIARAAIRKAVAEGQKNPEHQDWILYQARRYLTSAQLHQLAIDVGVRPLRR